MLRFLLSPFVGSIWPYKSHKSQGTKGFTNPSVDQSFRLCCTLTCCNVVSFLPQYTHTSDYTIYVFFFLGHHINNVYMCKCTYVRIYWYIWYIYISYNIIFVNQLCLYIWHTVSQFAFLGSIFHFGCPVFFSPNRSALLMHRLRSSVAQTWSNLFSLDGYHHHHHHHHPLVRIT